MKDGIENLMFYQVAQKLHDECWAVTELIRHDERGKELARQLVRSIGSVQANIEEGYGRGFGKEYPRFLRISRGSSRETRGWYTSSKHLMSMEIINARTSRLDFIIACITKSITTIENKKKKPLTALAPIHI